MGRHKLPIIEELEENDSEFSTVYSDLMSFVAGLFILLFTIVNTQKNAPAYFTELSLKFGGKIIEQEQTITAEDEAVRDIRKYIQTSDLSQYAVSLVDEQKIRIILNDPVLFESGTDILKPESYAILNGFIHIISGLKNPINIEGHTDDLPVNPGGKFRDNWDLAYFRASAVAHYFIKTGIDDDQLSITSLGDQRPLSPLNTSLARKKNRRIEINIIRVKEKDKI